MPEAYYRNCPIIAVMDFDQTMKTAQIIIRRHRSSCFLWVPLSKIEIMRRKE